MTAATEPSRPPHWKSKQSQYDLGVRTPVLLHWPGHIAPGISDELVSSIDLLPTSLAAAGLDIPENLPGLNLLPRALHGKPLVAQRRVRQHFQTYGQGLGPSETPTCSFAGFGPETWKLILPEIENEPARKLYHIAEDPLENMKPGAAPRTGRTHPDAAGPSGCLVEPGDGT